MTVSRDYELAERIVSAIAPQLCGVERAVAIREIELTVERHVGGALTRDRRDRPYNEFE
jgi:hypothetical protein